MGKKFELSYMLCKQWCKSYDNCAVSSLKKQSIEMMLKCEKHLSSSYPTLYSELFTTPSNMDMNEAFFYTRNRIEDYIRKVEEN